MNVPPERLLQEIGALYLESRLAHEEVQALREKVRALEEAATGDASDSGNPDTPPQ